MQISTRSNIVPYMDNPFQILYKFKDVKSILDEYNVSSKEVGYYWQIGEIEHHEGWILHLSVIKIQFATLLTTILPVLIEARVPFKVAKDVETARNLVDGGLGYSLLGKLVAVYPDTEELTLRLAKQLIFLTQGLRGPAIPTDYFLGGAVYTVYSKSDLFASMVTSDVAGIIPFTMQKGVKWPFVDFVPYAPYVKKQLWSYKYKPLSVIKKDVKGRVIKGNYFKSLFNIKFCLIKEGIKNMWADEFGRDITDRLRWQYELYKLLSGSILTPQIFDLFHEGENTYLVMEFIKGDSLHEKLTYIYESCSWFQLSGKTKLDLIDYCLNILDAISKLHEKGYVHRDITPANFIIKKQNTTYLIDMELTYSIFQKKPHPPFRQGTSGFISPEQMERKCPTIKEDIYALGALMICIFTGLYPLKIDPFSANIQRNLNNFTESSKITSLIAKCLSKEADDRPSITVLKKQIENYRNEVKAFSKADDKHFCTNNPGKYEVKEIINKAIIGLTHPHLLSSGHLWKSITRQNEIPGIPPVESSLQIGIHTGMTGVLYLLAKAKRAGFQIEDCMLSYNESWKYISTRYLDFPSNTKSGLYYGLSGIALAIHEGITAGLLSQDPYHRYLKKCFPPGIQEFNIAEGVAGQIIAILRCHTGLDREFTTRLLQNNVALLLEQQQKDGSWKIFRFNSEKVIGMGHGIAGVLYSLILYSSYYKDDKVLTAIQKGLNWLISTAHKRKGNISWATTTKSKSFDKWSSVMGPPGIALVFIKAYKITNEPLYKQMAEQVLYQLPNQPVYNDFSQGNGLSGLGEIYIEANRAFFSEEWQQRINWITSLFLNTFLQDDIKSGYWSSNIYPEREADLMTGTSGIIHFLMRYCTPDELEYPFC